MRAVLTVHEEGTPRRHVLRTRAVVGRDPGCDVVLADPTVSRRHAILELGPSGCRLRDLRSGNGTFADGHAVAEADLTGSERLRFGAVQAELAFEEEAADLTASQKLRMSLSVAPSRRSRPVAAAVVSTAVLLGLLSVTAWERGCLGRPSGAARPAGAAR